MTTEIIIITALSVFVLLLVCIILILLFKRTGGRLDPSSVFVSISQRLDELVKMQAQVKDLSSMLLAPQSRGAIGEVMLEELIKNMLPRGYYKFQHQYASGVRVDAFVKIGNKYIPIDAKFPVQALKDTWVSNKQEKRFSQELRRTFIKYMTDIAGKYIEPRENTADFALMYIPSEAIFYEGFVKYQKQGTGTEDLFSIALKERVVPVSPSSLFLYLQTIAWGLKGFEYDKKYDQLIKTVEQLRMDFLAFSRLFSTAGTHLRNLNKAYDESLSKVSRVDLAIQRLEKP